MTDIIQVKWKFKYIRRKSSVPAIVYTKIVFLILHCLRGEISGSKHFIDPAHPDHDQVVSLQQNAALVIALVYLVFVEEVLCVCYVERGRVDDDFVSLVTSDFSALRFQHGNLVFGLNSINREQVRGEILSQYWIDIYSIVNIHIVLIDIAHWIEYSTVNRARCHHEHYIMETLVQVSKSLDKMHACS